MGFFVPGFFVAAADMQALRDGQAKIISLLNQLVQGSTNEMAALKDVQAEIDAIAKSVSANTDAEASAVTLLQTISASQKALTAQLAAAIANGDPVAIQTALDGLTSQQKALDANTAALAAAVVANTPA